MTNILIATTQITNTEYFVLIAVLVFNIPFTPKLKPVLNVLKINMFHILPIHTAVKPFFLKRVYFKLVLIKTAKEMAGNIEEPSKKKTKRSRHLEENETRILVSKWSGENIQELLKSCTRKKPIWKEVSIFLRASGYDRDDERCSNIPTNDSDSDTFDEEVPLKDLNNAINIPISTSKKTLAGSSRRLTGKQNETSL